MVHIFSIITRVRPCCVRNAIAKIIIRLIIIKKKKIYIALSGLRRSTELSGVTIVIVRERQGWRSHERMTFVSIGNKLTTSQKRRGRPLCRISVSRYWWHALRNFGEHTDIKYKTSGIKFRFEIR